MTPFLYPPTLEEQARATSLGMGAREFLGWRSDLRSDYKAIGRSLRMTRWRGVLRPWMVPGSDQTSAVDEAA